MNFAEDKLFDDSNREAEESHLLLSQTFGLNII